MYDSDTVKLINEAPKFGSLNLEELPKDFTNDYTKIISFRLCVHDQLINEADFAELIDIQKESLRIALTYEAYLAGNSKLVTKEMARAAAFVSASAHQVWGMAEKLRISTIENISYINSSFIHPDLSCAILFFISGYTADASEMAKSIEVSDDQTTEIFLVKNIKNLLAGRVTLPIENPLDTNLNGWGEKFALEILWKIINKGVVILLNVLAGAQEENFSDINDAITMLEEALDYSSDTSNVELDNFTLSFSSTFAGPRHLAALLILLADEIEQIALVKTSAPAQINQIEWETQLKAFAKNRPYLWPNHLEAIKAGYLEIGVSSVVSFPTGGGKSTLAELKITAALLNNKSIIFIAPTLALVDQITKNLNEAFPTVKKLFDMSDFGMESIEIEELPDISVMTPESCLLRMSFNPELFDNGLFIFDECHLLHPKNSLIDDRRSIDSMLCLTYILELASEVDILLMSAMMKNSEDLANWISELSGRKTLALNISWKPTRQARGCVVYKADEVTNLNDFIGSAPKTNSGRLKAPDRRKLLATPYSLFSMNQTWHSNEMADYRLVKLLSSKVTLGVNDFNYLTANKNHVSSELAHQANLIGIKTLIFTDTKKNCNSLINNDHYRQSKLVLNRYEQSLLDLIIEEFGGQSFTYVHENSICLPHHGLLTKTERTLHESLFKRKSGIGIMVATSTLAQGMNLPAELVIIAGNTRFDQNLGQQEEINAHDILNAAGRAGRAGESAKGLVLIIPSKIVSFNPTNNRITPFFFETIKEVFSESDQCLEILDPIKLILDKIHADPEIDERNISYFIERIPNVLGNDLAPFLNKTFGAYQARLRNDLEWINSRINAANNAFFRIREVNPDKEPTWHDKLAAASGVSSQMIQDLADHIKINVNDIHDMNSALMQLFMWLSGSMDRITTILRSGSIEEVFGREYLELDDTNKPIFIGNHIYELCLLWLKPLPISQIEVAISGSETNLGKCDKARRFILRLIPEISFCAGIFSQAYKKIIEDQEMPQTLLLDVEMLSLLIKNGFNNVQKLALNSILKSDKEVSRMSTSKIYDYLMPYLDDSAYLNDYSLIYKSVEVSYLSYLNETF